jgi:hypothetical protein
MDRLELMGNGQEVAVNKAWKILFEKHNIVSKVSVDGFF